jgi:hypothetical protein
VQITVTDFVAGAAAAHGVAVIIDVFRACSVQAYAFAQGASRVVAGIAPRLRAAPSAAKFFDPAMDWAPLADFAHCAAVDRFDFVIRLMARDSLLPYLKIAA